MYPNPQEALPLPPRPNINQYKKLAKDLVKSCRSGAPAAIRVWALTWIQALAALQPESRGLQDEHEIAASVERLEPFARRQLTAGSRSLQCRLFDAHFVIARAHGFVSWATFSQHVESLNLASSSVSTFEAAVDAIVAGDAPAMGRLLREQPDLVRARSTREHCATLLHYVSANGVEGYRQVSPGNIAEIARMLLAAGAEVDAGMNVYGSRKTTALGLVATSAPPADAGVQLAVIDVLLDHGARPDVPGIAGRNDRLIRACLANGQAEAAAHLASRGAPVDLTEAAGLGRIDLMSRFFDGEGGLNSGATEAQAIEGFSFACIYGRTDAVSLLLDRGVDVNAELKGHGEGHTGLHVAAYHGHADVASELIARGARVDAIDRTWGTTPLVWAVTGWSRKSKRGERYYEAIERLVRAGARVTPELLESAKVQTDPRMLAALRVADR
jgi:hypothetical protein